MNIVNSAKNYFVGSFTEMKKVTWPTREQTINYSILVVALSLGLAIFFAALDYGFSTGITALISR